MLSAVSPSLTFDEIDDLLYFTRVNERDDLQQTIIDLSKKYECSEGAILEAAVDSENGNTVLHYCSANGFDDLLPVLLSKLGAEEPSSNVNGGSKAARLFNRGNKEGNTPLHWAALNGHLAVVKLLVEAGADMWAKNAAGHLALFEAERAEKNEVVQYLLEAGGKEVENAGTEGQPSEDDVVEVQAGEHGEPSASTGANGGVALDEESSS